jgi:cobalt/nickel transport system permease protein
VPNIPLAFQKPKKHPAGLAYGLMLGWLATTAMHIPDGYLSPITCLVMLCLVLPFWVMGVRALRERLSAKSIPLVALFSAFSFIIMMFNVPLPGGTTGHAVGGALAAIILGPEIACVAISIALVIQAFFFGDGGILAIGANCFNMAVVLPFVAAAAYQFIARQSPAGSRQRIAGAAAGGWLGLTASSFFAAAEFGIQPALWQAADGTPLYAPYPLSVSIPAMVIPHMLIASVVEALVTAGVVAYLQRANQPALEFARREQMDPEQTGIGKWRTLWALLAMLIMLAPIGLLAPGTAWGEWGADELASRGLSFIPSGMEKLSGLWSAPFPDYDLPALGNANLAYLLSAAVGILVVGICVWLFASLARVGRPAPPKTK